MSWKVLTIDASNKRIPEFVTFGRWFEQLECCTIFIIYSAEKYYFPRAAVRKQAYCIWKWQSLHILPHPHDKWWAAMPVSWKDNFFLAWGYTSEPVMKSPLITVNWLAYVAGEDQWRIALCIIFMIFPFLYKGQRIMKGNIIFPIHI